MGKASRGKRDRGRGPDDSLRAFMGDDPRHIIDADQLLRGQQGRATRVEPWLYGRERVGHMVIGEQEHMDRVAAIRDLGRKAQSGSTEAESLEACKKLIDLAQLIGRQSPELEREMSLEAQTQPEAAVDWNELAERLIRHLAVKSPYTGMFVDDHGRILRGGLTKNSWKKHIARCPTPPMWAGSFSFEQVWRACWDTTVYAPLVGWTDKNAPPGKTETMGAQQTTCMIALDGLKSAVPVYIGEEQLLALPPWEQKLSDVIPEVDLPFAATYLDFSSARGPARVPLDGTLEGTYVTVTGAVHMLYHGALVINYPDVEGTPDGPDGMGLMRGLTIIPFASTVIEDDGEERPSARGDGVGVYEGTPMGFVSFSRERPTELDIVSGIMRTPMLAKSGGEGIPHVGYMAACVPAWQISSGDFKLSGYIHCGEINALRSVVSAMREPGEARPDHVPIPDDSRLHFEGQAAGLLTLSSLALKALWLVQAANMHMEDAPVPRQQRRQVERKNGGIAKVVRITRPTRVPGRREPSGEGRSFSHRFNRRAHYKHVTRGPHAKADFIKPCSRRDPKSGELTCPDGCRREYVPSTIIGDDSLPYVPKTLVWPGKDKLMDGGR